MRAYTPQAYAFVSETSRRSAAAVVPLVMELVRPASVVDFGCGTGDWLAAFLDAGCQRVLGIDGPWVPAAQLAIPPSRFRSGDLREPVRLDERFDLGLCLEVVGHIPESREDVLLDSLAAAAPVLAFSGPIPLQGGIGDGRNRRWPAYWAARLEARGFAAVDCIRPLLWDDPRVAFWFAQNLFLAVRKDTLPGHPALAAAHRRDGAPPRAIVHPRCFEENVLQASRLEELPLRELVPRVAAAVAGRLARRARAVLRRAAS